MYKPIGHAQANLKEKMGTVDEMKKSILETRSKKLKLRLAAESAEAFIMVPSSP